MRIAVFASMELSGAGLEEVLALHGSSVPVPILEQTEPPTATPRGEKWLAYGNAGLTTAQIADPLGVTQTLDCEYAPAVNSRPDPRSSA
jgi:hypothetical protein